MKYANLLDKMHTVSDLLVDKFGHAYANGWFQGYIIGTALSSEEMYQKVISDMDVRIAHLTKDQ